MDRKIVSIKEYRQRECEHNNVTVDEALWLIECDDCGKALDPIQYLIMLARDQERLELRAYKLRNECQRVSDIISLKTKVRCEHCNKMTAINTDSDARKLGLLLKCVNDAKNNELNTKAGSGNCDRYAEGFNKYLHEYYLLRELPEKRLYVCKRCGKSIWEDL